VIRLGATTISSLRLGATQASAAYVGAVQVWGASGAPSPRHTVFGGTRPSATLDRQNDSHGWIRIVTLFRRRPTGDPSIWRILGGRVYVNTDVSGWTGSGWQLELWPAGTISPDLKAGSGKSPLAAKALPATIDNTVGYYDVVFDAPVPMPENTVFWLGYSNPAGEYVAPHPGDGLALTEIQATDGSDLWIGGVDSPASGRGQFAYGDGSSDGTTSFWSGVDILVDEG
jgi:hypothetical protein